MEYFLDNGADLVERSNGLFGASFTNSVIEGTAGKLFTSGPSISSLTRDSDEIWNRHKVGGVANYVMEGIEDEQPKLFDRARDDMVETVRRYCTPVRPYTHLAIKLSGLGSMGML